MFRIYFAICNSLDMFRTGIVLKGTVLKSNEEASDSSCTVVDHSVIAHFALEADGAASLIRHWMLFLVRFCMLSLIRHVCHH